MLAAQDFVHLVNVYDGIGGRRLECKRCWRLLPEARFVPIGTKDLPGRSGRVVTMLHPHCHTCRKQAKGKWIKHPEYTAELDRFWSTNIIGLKGGAKKRGLLFAIDKDDILGKYLEQNGLCAMSGIRMDPFKNGPVGKASSYYKAPSVDRIDSNGHYTVENIQIVMLGVNIMKGQLPSDVFVELCGAIATNNLLR